MKFSENITNYNQKALKRRTTFSPKFLHSCSRPASAASFQILEL